MTLVDSSQGELVSRLRRYYERARAKKRRRYDRWSRSWKLLNNRYGGASANWMPQPRDSQVYPVCAALVSWMTDQRVSFEITASADQNSPQGPLMTQLAEDLERIMANCWAVENWGKADRLVLWDAVAFGAGIYKAVWDPSLADGLGNASLTRVDPWRFYPDPNATGMEDANYFVEVREMSWDEFERRYAGASRVAHEATAYLSVNAGLDERPALDVDMGKSPMTNPGALPGGNVRWSDRRPGPQGDHDEDTVVVQEFWLKENRQIPSPFDDDEEEVVDAWRVVVVANGDVVMDEPAEELWDAGRHPYVRFAFDDLGGDFWGTSLVEHLSQPQIYLNRLLTALQHNAELIGNPIFINPANSGLDRVGVMNRPGQKLTVNSSALQGGSTGPQWLRPPDMPDGVRQLVEYWGRRMKEIAGTDALSLPQNRQAERTVSQSQEAAFVRIRDAIRSREQALAEAGRLLANLIVENYTAPRIVAIVGQQGEKTAMSLIGRHFYAPTATDATPLRFGLVVQAGSSRPTNRAQRMAEAQVLRGLSALDTLSFLQMLEVPNAQVIYQRLLQEQQAGGDNQPGARQRARKGTGGQ